MPTKNIRARQWTFIAYPESLPEGWKDWLASNGFRVVISPLHDKDTKSDGTLKKAHYHVLIIFSGKKSLSQVKEVTDELHATQPMVLRGDSVGLVRYFLHLDDPQKYQYDRKDIVSIGGVDVDKLLQSTKNDDEKLLHEMYLYIIHHRVYNFALLNGVIDYLERDDWRRVMRSNLSYVRMLLDSEYQLLHRKSPVDFDTEVRDIVEHNGKHVADNFMSMFGDGSKKNDN